MDIKISRTARTCFACQREFAHEEEVKSLVRVRDKVLMREDYCQACWDFRDAAKVYCAWAPRFLDPKVAQQEPPEVFSPLRQVFYEAVESEDRCDMAKAYLAAQLLRRQKVFRLIKEADDPDGEAVRVALFADRIGDKLIEVRDPSLTHAEMETGRQALLVRLAELENPEPEPDEDDQAQTCDEKADDVQSQEED